MCGDTIKTVGYERDSGIRRDEILSMFNQKNGWIGNLPMAEKRKLHGTNQPFRPVVSPSRWILLSLGEDTRSCPLPRPCHSTARILSCSFALAMSRVVNFLRLFQGLRVQ